jgi:hypothetical protein
MMMGRGGSSTHFLEPGGHGGGGRSRKGAGRRGLGRVNRGLIAERNQTDDKDIDFVLTERDWYREGGSAHVFRSINLIGGRREEDSLSSLMSS